MQVAVMLLMLCVIVPVGRLSDRIGRKPILMTASWSLIVLGLPSVWLMREGITGQIVGLLIMGGILVCFAAVTPSTLPALFPTLVRYGGLAVAFNMAVSAFAGTAPTIIETAVTTTGNLDWPGYYLIGAGVVGVMTLHFIKESAGKPLAGAAPLISSADLPPPPMSADRVPREPPHD
jgi:MHS family proline/betaine transporter-like MFS transporter